MTQRALCNGDFLPLFHQGFLHLHHNGAFHSLSEELTAILIGAGNISGGVVGICRTASGTVKLCPTFSAVLSGIDIGISEFFSGFFLGNAVPNISQLIFLIGYELVTGVELTLGGNCHILGSGTANGDSLINAGASIQIPPI